MKKLLFILLGLAVLSGCGVEKTANTSNVNAVKNFANNSANLPANMEAKTADLKAYGDSQMTADERVREIDAYVKSIESKLPKPDADGGTGGTLERKISDLSGDTYQNITDEKWDKMHTYYDGEKLERLKVYSPESEKKTEEFYFYNDKPVFAFIENDGMSKSGDSSEANGDKFYFGSEGLFRMIKADGGKVESSSEEFKKYNEKLPKEASAFRSAGK